MSDVIIIIVIIVVLIFALVCFFGAPYVPTRKAWAEAALGLVQLSDDDLVVDLGAGGGKILRLLAQKGIKSVGYELNPLLYASAKVALMNTALAKVYLANYWVIDLPESTTVVYAFMVQRDAEKLEKYLARQVGLVKAKKLKLVAFGFDLPNKKPIKTSNGARLYEFK